MHTACDYCATPVKESETFVKCMGFCEGVAHLRCTKSSNLKMNSSFLKIINECSNLFWMCDECTKLMKVARFRFTIESVGDAIDSIQQENNRVNSELKDLITKQGQQLISLSKRVATTAANRLPTPRTPTTNRTLKRSRDSDHVPSKALVFGTNGVESAGITCIPPDEKLFWLYVSRFSNITTALQVEGLVKNVIGQDKYVQATALVKKGVDPLSLPFISFKVGVAFTDKEAITNPAIWPGNCGFREFEDVQRKLQSLQTGSGAAGEKTSANCRNHSSPRFTLDFNDSIWFDARTFRS